MEPFLAGATHPPERALRKRLRVKLGS
jgi:hypothetical protein